MSRSLEPSAFLPENSACVRYNRNKATNRTRHQFRPSMSQSQSTAEILLNEPDTRPELRTKRLCLRPFDLADAPAMEALANHRQIAANTLSIDFPYPDGQARKWIAHQPESWLLGKSVVFAICDLESERLMGAIGMEISEANQSAELGYWLGEPFWNCGFCTEAARAVVEFGFEVLALHKIHSQHMLRNPASGRVLEKVGFRREGLLREHIRKWGVFEDVVVYGILNRDYRQSRLRPIGGKIC